MCGISGIYNLTNNNSIETNQLKLMTNQLKHRGPDDEGYFLCNTVSSTNHFASGNDTQGELKSKLMPIENCKSCDLGFGFRRLSIQDLTVNGHQPMIDYNKKAVIVFNGEVYNFMQLRDQLLKKGYLFNSLTDSEVVLNAYLEWGEKCVEYFNGMWSFAIWDIFEKKLFCSRDRFGIKPFYYFNINGKFAFASEIKALLKLTKAKLNKNSLFKYIYFDEIDTSEETFFDNIFQLFPGQSMTIKNGILKKKIYYKLEENLIECKKSSTKIFFKHFKRAVKLRLKSDVKVGFALSGGVDSSSIVTAVNQIDDNKLNSTFSIVYPNKKIDESSYINSVIKKTGYENFRITPSATDFKNDLKNFVYFQEEPIPDLSYFNEFKLRELIRSKNVTVTLEGQGADEVISGYKSFVLPFFLDLLKKFKFKKLNLELKKFKHLNNIKLSHLLLRFFYSRIPLKLQLYIKKTLKVKSISIISKTFFLNQDHKTFPLKKGSYLNSALLNSLKIYSIPKQLTRADKNAMAFSIECRFPFLDHNFVEYVYNLPDSEKMSNGITKKILRDAMKNKLPDKIINRKDKIGFLSPQSEWILDLEVFFDGIIYSDSFKKCDYLNWTEFEKSYLDFKKGNQINSKMIWKILGIYLWQETFNVEIS